jgi:carboxypeptidase family protein
MSAERKWRVCFFVLAAACLTPSLSAVIVVMREYHGKQVACGYSGLVGVAKACGTEGYARVFTGIVWSSVEKGDTDKILELVPDEVFVGDTSEATAITNQACLDTDIQAGDKWLFYLNRDPNSDTLVLSYAGPSKPIGESEDDISMLRDLGHLKNAGILIGTIERLGDTEDGEGAPLANHKVVAKNVANRTQYTAYTNEKGHFKFKLPVGTYDLTTAPEYGLREVESFGSMLGSIPVEDRRCWEHDFAVKAITAIKPKTDGIISGHVGSPDGKPFTVHPWVQILSVDSEMFTSAYVDAKGYFEAKNVKPGRYVVGLGIRPGTGYFSDVPTPVYYPGVRTKEEATIIELRSNEKRTNVDFQLPPEDVLKPLGPAKSNR